MILSIGNINIDIICSVPHLPMADEKIVATDVTNISGGAACNFAVGLSRLGDEVAVYGHIGNDYYGNEAKKSLEKEKVDVSRVKVEDDESTGFVLILVDQKGQTIKIGYREANNLLTPESITEELFEDVSFVHVASVNAELALKIAEVCQELELPTSIDIGGELMDEEPAIGRKILRKYQYSFLNQIAFERFFGKAVELIDQEKLQLKSGQIMNVTYGDQGSYIITKDELEKIPAWDVSVVDTTGAGDAYACAFIHYFQKGLSLYETGLHASASAALQITKHTARNGMPTNKEIKTFIEEHKDQL
jgi:ribokinase